MAAPPTTPIPADALRRAFLDALALPEPSPGGDPAPTRDLASCADLEAGLQACHAQGGQPWPAFPVGAEAFAAHLGRCLAGDARARDEALAALCAGRAPEGLKLDDLYLACACAGGDSAAIRAFESRYARNLSAIVQQFAGKGRAPDDLRQILRERLFVGTAERPPRIWEYRGTGTLKAWLKVTAVRAFLDETRRVGRREKEDVAPGEALLDLPAQTDWELDFLKQRYREAFREAFWEALATLSAEQRNLLRYHTVEGLTLDQIASITPYHRSSVARRLQKARQELLVATRAALGAALRVEEREFESIMALIQSRLDVSLSRVLVASPGAGEPEGRP